LDILVNLFSKLIDKIIPEEEDEKAIRSEDEIVDEEDIFKALE